MSVGFHGYDYSNPGVVTFAQRGLCSRRLDVTRRLELALRAASEALEIDARGKYAIHLATSHIKIAAYEIALGDLSAA